MRLEPTDHGILRELLAWGEGNFPKGTLKLTVRELAQRTGLHRNTVQRRLQALREGGVVSGFLYEPRPGPLGLVRAGTLFAGIDVDDGAHLARVLEPFPFVSIAVLHAETCFLHTWHESEADANTDMARMKRVLGANDARRSFISTHLPPHPADSLALSPLDRRVLLALRRGTDRSVARVARETHMSRRNAARRIDRFIETEAGALMPMFHAGAIEGELIAVYDAMTWDHTTCAGLADAFPDRIMGPTGGGARPMVMVPVPSFGEAVRRKATATKLPGLAGVELFLMRDIVFPEACDAWLAEHVQNAPPRAVKS